MSLAELRQLEMQEQQMLVCHAIRAWLSCIDQTKVPRVVVMSLTGDFLWNEEHQQAWVAVRKDWHGNIIPVQPIIENGEVAGFQPLDPCAGDFEEVVFMRVFSHLAEFDSIAGTDCPPAMYGLRESPDVEGIHQYYEEQGSGR